MALSYKARRRWSLIILLVGLPLYVILAVNIVALFDRPSIWVELLVYVGLGVLWAFPLKAVFKGVGQPDPDADHGRGD
ncbi:DUF2842 domain-containing protein [Pseudosulfitobacter pseudonitzschiae]|uniref:DUF2842 domain-containing protein n=1 Tax=Pseudosulfitobacter pseudonitzschiae TaxID=1402135 RepID=A0A073J1V0_9RHOB|nr:DUF2842 domain-containing protein [Pseudosulfitobacter pseudonitzschiae]KEJ95830.1 hypothetical protein SUH3_20185 [Pseudosulfitobacter pseudonitzschiae]MBM1813753.1 DUF2842 domain-containing protein [Pseudosulfitobacter pseudonitzschiae]MBM1830746.1 DUF2842 domain-containing protein [Pseudosulfitobacter pseudonitzschiae]MBM1835613.1 DUF2842 domain-containing protein [Pseudosulfitobacter pseudonitzschiae]MBM1840459.1 DUF2842 domain-containing protein [Pseudosulfitobacter pseudonitzschiae]